MTAKGDYFPVGPNMFVPNCKYAADCSLEGKLFVNLTPNAPIASAANTILAATSIAVAGSTSTFLIPFTEAQMGKFGRNLIVNASGAATSNVTIQGYDYLGQPMAESFTLAGAASVVGQKAFRRVTLVTFGATAATTINVGVGVSLGLPYANQGDMVDYTNEVRSGSQGTSTLRVATQTLTSGDPRGLFTPSSAPDGNRKYSLTYEPYRNALYGAAHVVS